MTPDLLRQAGEALYGARWQAPIAAAIGVAPAQINNWLAGRERIPPGKHTAIATALRAAIDARAPVLRDARRALQAAR